MLTGVVIAESLREGAEVDRTAFTITKIRRVAVGEAAEGQPTAWTLIEFEADEAGAEVLAGQLAAALDPAGAWYIDFHTRDETFIVFAGKVSRYPRGNVDGRRQAAAYAVSIGVPRSQLDWRD